MIEYVEVSEDGLSKVHRDKGTPYRFGREVTVKLPEPDEGHEDANREHWSNQLHDSLGYSIQSFSKVYYPDQSPTRVIEVEFFDSYSSYSFGGEHDELRHFAYALLAAADYAEHSKPQTLGMPGELVAVDEPTHAENGDTDAST